VIAAYASALQSENVASVRAAYTGLTTQQAAAWQGLFDAAEDLRITHTVTSVDVSGSTATARVSALHEFRNTADRGRAVKSEFLYTATLTRAGETWRITRIQ
jgi:ketosteroid isomerase-like protein